jgi:hypothetical protein
MDFYAKGVTPHASRFFVLAEDGFSLKTVRLCGIEMHEESAAQRNS